jgi:hypothetical protein
MGRPAPTTSSSPANIPARACRLIGISGEEGSDGGALATTHEAGVRRPDVRAAVRLGKVLELRELKQKARSRLLRAGRSNSSR